jgi:hypothetical protein
MLITKEQATEQTRLAYKWCLSKDIGTGSARIIASIIIHCYNGSAKAELENLGCLDSERINYALGVIALRGFGVDPHLVIENGGKITEKLAVKFGFEK